MAWPKFLRALLPQPSPSPAPAAPEAITPPPQPRLVVPAPAPDEGTAEPAAPAAARDPDLEAALVAGPHDAAAFSVYADWLTERGDIRGEWIALALALAADPDRADRADLELRLDAIQGDHLRHLYGPLFDAVDDPYEALTGEELGFIRVLSLARCTRAHLPAIRAQLADVAGLLVHTIHAPTRLHAALAPLLADRTPAVALVDPAPPAGSLVGQLRVDRPLHAPDRLRVYATFRIPEWAADLEDHAFLARTTVVLDDGTRHAWTNGMTSTLVEGFGEVTVHTGVYELPAAPAASARVTMEIRFAAATDDDDDEPTVATYAGTRAIACAAGPYALDLALGAALTGAPFDAVTPVDEPRVARGPARADLCYEAIAIPGVGILEPSRIVRTDGGSVALQQEGVHVAASSSPDGAVVARLTRRDDAFTLTTIVKPAAGKPRIHRAQLAGAWAAVVALAADRIAVLGDAGALLADAQARIVWRGTCGSLGESPGAILERDAGGRERLTLAGEDGAATFVLPSTLADASAEMLVVGRPTAVAPATYDPRRGRSISLRCLDDDADGRALIVVAWRDGDGPQREVYLRDRRCEPDDIDGIAVIPDDGRIVAVGRAHVWLVDPRGASVARLGERGDCTFQTPPLVTRTPAGRYRLWNGGSGPAYLEFA